MTRIIQLERGINIGEYMIKDINYNNDKPYLLADMFTNQEIGWKNLNELRKIEEAIEDYNIPFEAYVKKHSCKLLSFSREELIDLFNNLTKYIEMGCENELRGVICLELEGADIELNIRRCKESEEKSPYKVFFYYFICEKINENDDWDSNDYSYFAVDVEKMKSLLETNKKVELTKMLYNTLVKSCRNLNLYFTKINK